MPHNVIGLDLGSHTVKAIVTRVSLRGREVIRFVEEPVTLDEKGHSTPAQVFEAARRLAERLHLQGDTIHCAVPGQSASMRRLEIPTSASKQLEHVLKFEFDDILPFDIEETVFDFVELGRSLNNIVVLAAAVQADQVRSLITGLSEAGLDPREIGVAPLSYVPQLLDPKAAEDDVAAFIDFGHTSTNIAVIDKLSPTFRTILRGGRDLSQRLAESGKVTFEQAEEYKHLEGMTGRVGEILREALSPWIREVRQTIKGHLAAGGERLKKIYLCGGGAKLKGIQEYLGDELGVPVELYEVKLSSAVGGDLQSVTFPLAYALAIREAQPRGKRINMRRGEFAFKGDFEFLRKKVGWIAACILGLISAWAFSTYAEFQVLEKVVVAQEQQIAQLSKRYLGDEILELEKLREKLGGELSAEVDPVPKIDAFHIVVELSKRIPDTVVHDVESLEIKPKRITLRGIVDADLASGGGLPFSDMDEDSQQEEGSDPPKLEEAEGTELSPTDLIKQKLEEFKECFTAIRVGKVTARGERRRYEMDIESRCP